MRITLDHGIQEFSDPGMDGPGLIDRTQIDLRLRLYGQSELNLKTDADRAPVGALELGIWNWRRTGRGDPVRGVPVRHGPTTLGTPTNPGTPSARTRGTSGTRKCAMGSK